MMMISPIDGSTVHEAGTIPALEDTSFSPDFKEYVRKEQLIFSRVEDEDEDEDEEDWEFGWVFWSQQDHQTQLADLIRHALHKLLTKDELYDCLVQFWAPTKTSDGRTLLTTQFQPFALGRTLRRIQFQPFALGPTYCISDRNKLCEYRMGMYREYNNSFYADAESPQEQLGVPGRVFLHQSPEITPRVEHYTLKEYPQRDLALRCKIESSFAVPVFDQSTHAPVGVLEFVYFKRYLTPDSFLGQMYDMKQMYDIFQECGLLCFDGYKHYQMQIGDQNKARTIAFLELKMVLKKVCKIHELPLAMTWVPCSACKYLLRGQLNSKGVEFCDNTSCYMKTFSEVSKSIHLRKGVVAEMVLSSCNMLYCSDITQLSVDEYPLVLYARLCRLRGWFTICLQSSYAANDVYVLELFLPMFCDNPWTSLSKILGTMEEHFITFKLAFGKEPGDVLSVEVMDFQNGEIHRSRQHIQAKGVGVMLQLRQLDQVSMGSTHSGTNLFSEDQNYIFPSHDALQNAEVAMQVDSSHQSPLDSPNTGQNVVIAERNINAVTSSEECKGKTRGEHKRTGVRIEVSSEDILECAKMSREQATKKLGVSVSTFKRVCRDHGIKRWPPRNIEKSPSFRPSPIENEGQARQFLNYGLPPNQASDSVAHTNPAFQVADIVTIRAKYERHTIKFRLSLPSSLVALQQEVAKRLNLEAGTYHVRYNDEINELILIICDEDLQFCIDTFKSLGNTEVVVLLEPK